MKLHLPCGLRKALLACLAALAAHCRIPRTVSTGTALLGVFAMLWGAASHAATQQDQDSPLSEDEEVLLLDEPDELTFDAPNLLSEDDEYGLQRFLAANNEENVMTISQDDSGIMPVAAPEGAFEVNAHAGGTASLTDAYNNHNQAGTTWNINLDSGTNYFPPTTNPILANIYLSQTLTINQGSSRHTVTFQGAITGEDVADLVYAWVQGANVGWKFTANTLDNFSGNISTSGRENDTDAAHTFTCTIEGNSNRGAITLNGRQDVLELHNATMRNFAINVTTLNVANKDTSTTTATTFGVANVTVTGTLTTAAGSTALFNSGNIALATVTNNGTLSLAGTASATLNGVMSGGGSLAIGGTASLTVNANNSVTVNSLTMSGGTLTSNGTGLVSVNDVLTMNGGSITVGDRLSLVDNGHTHYIRGGASVTAAEMHNVNGHVGNLVIGGQVDGSGAVTNGKLTVGSEASTVTADLLKARTLWISNAQTASEAGNRSVVTVYGGVNLYTKFDNSTLTATGLSGDVCVLVDGASDLIVKGAMHGNNNALLESVYVRNNATMTVEGMLSIQNDNKLDINTGTVTLNGGLTANSVALTQGSLTAGGTKVTGTFTMGGGVTAQAAVDGLSAGSLVTLENGKSLTLESGALTITDAVDMSGGELRLSGGAVSVANGIDASGGTLVLGSVRVAEDLKITLRDSAVLELAGGAQPTIDGISRITLGIEVADDALSGGKLKLTRAAMETLLKWEGQINFSITGAPIGAIWDYDLFDTTGWSGADAAAAKTFLEKFLGLEEQGGSIKVDSLGNVHYALAGDLTWTGQDGETGNVWDEAAGNWEEGGKEHQVFGDKDSVRFGDDGSGHSDIIVSGELTVGDIRVEDSSTYSFTGEGGDDSINAVGNLYVRAGSSATFSNLKSFSVAGGTLQGILKLENTGTENSLGSMIVKSGGDITIVGETAKTTLTSLDIEGGSLTSFGAEQDGSGSVGGAITVNGAMTVSNVDGQSGQVNVTGDLSASSLVVSGTGVSVSVSGTMGVGNLDTNDPLLRIDQGGSVTAGSLKGFGGNGYAGRILVGENDAGTLTVGSEGKEVVLVLEARGLSVQGRDSNVTVYGDASLYGSYDDAHALLVTGATVHITGTLRAPNSADDPSSAVRVENNGELIIGNGAWVQGSLAVLSSSTVTVGKRLSLEDSNDPVLIVTGGSSVTAGSIWGGTDTGVAGRLTVGDAASAGTLTVGGGDSVEEEVLKAKSLYVQHADSEVTIYGDVKLTGATADDDNNALKLEGGSSMTVHGGVHGADGGSMSGGVSLTGGSDLTVDGDVASSGTVFLNGASSLTVDGSVESDALQITNGTATLKGGLTAGSVNFIRRRAL